MVTVVLVLVAVLVVFWVAGWIIGFLNATIPGFGCLLSVLPLVALVAGIMALSEGEWERFGIWAVVFVVSGFAGRVVGSIGPRRAPVYEDSPPPPRRPRTLRDHVLPPPPPPAPEPDPLPPQEGPQGWVGYGYPPGMEGEQPYPDDRDPARRDPPPTSP